MNKKLRIGVMGLIRGEFVLRVARLMPDDVIMAAVCETNEAQIERVRPLFGPETKVFSDFDEFLESGLDAVVLCNFFHEHTEYAIKAMEKGIAVMSELMAAPTLGGLVDLVEAVERTKGKYMLGVNCQYFKAVTGMKKKIESGEYGDLLYADAEYVHTHEYIPVEKRKKIDPNNVHWRQTMPPCYYNMHSLGPLMYIAEAEPKKVIGKAVVHERDSGLNNTPKTYAITEMTNGAVFNTTGHVSCGTTSKWYRLGCERGTIETDRYDWREERLIEAGHEIGKKYGISYPAWNLTPEETKKYMSPEFETVGHGGIDFVLLLEFIKYVRGEMEIFFDVYRAASLTAAAILTWYSILEGSKEYDIPDFRDKEAREVFRGDYRTPVAKEAKDRTLPWRI